MNLTSIDALALAQAARTRVQDQANRMPFPSLGPSSLLADPNSIAAMAARRASMPAYPPSSSAHLVEPSGGGGIDGAAYLALLDRQRHLLGPAKANAAPLTAAPPALAAEAAAVGPLVAAPAPPSRRRKPNFAKKLHAALSGPDCRDSATWLPSGRAFCITDQKAFVKNVLPKHFREAKFESFNRRLKRWGFRKVYEAGLHQTVFAHAHDLFRRDRYDLCAVMNGRSPVGRVTIDKGREDKAALGLGLPAGPGLPPNPVLPAQDTLRDAAMLRLAQQQLALRHMSQRNAAAAVPQPQGHSSPGAGGSFARAILNEAMARVSDPRAQANAASAELAAAQPRNNPFPSTGSSLAQATMHEAFARANDSHSQAAMNKAMAPANDSQARVMPVDADEILRAKAQLDRLNDDIANYNRQLAVLQRLRELQEARGRGQGQAS